MRARFDDPSPSAATPPARSIDSHTSASSHSVASRGVASGDLASEDVSPGDVAGWVEPGWVDAVRHEQVRALMHMPPGIDLMSRLQQLSLSRCPCDHSAEAILVSGQIRRRNTASDDVELVADVTEADSGEAMGVLTPGTVSGLPCACQLVLAAAWSACVSWVQHHAGSAVVMVAGTGPLDYDTGYGATVTDPVREELAGVLRISPRSAGTRIAAARRRAHCGPLTEVLVAGLLSAPACDAICEVLGEVADPLAQQIAVKLSAQISHLRGCGHRGWTPSQARQAARAALCRHCPDALVSLQRNAQEARRVELRPVGDGTSWLAALLPEIDALRIYRRLTAQAMAQAADAPPADHRLLGQRRADLLRDQLLSATGHHAPPGATDAVEVRVVAGVETLLGLAEDPGYIEGLGSVPADIARALAAEGSWQAWLTDVTGQVTSAPPQRYRPAASLARAIIAREATCRFPGCHQRAERCDLDHTIPWPAAPGSVPENLGPLCRRHHNLKTHLHHGLTAHWRPSGTVTGWTWTMPSGLTHHVTIPGALHLQPEPSPPRRARRRRPRRLRRVC